MKVCSMCGEAKGFDMFNPHKPSTGGRRAHCKACANDYAKAYYEANKERVAERQKAYNKANKKQKVEYAKAYREANKERVAEQKKAYREANKEQIKAYYEANKEWRAERQKAYYEANKEQNKAYREANKEQIDENRSRYRARKLKAIPKFLRSCDLEKQRIRDIFKLRDVFNKVSGIEHHVDHMWPLSKGGPHWSGNLQVIPATENLSKNAKVCKTTKRNIKANLEIARKEYEYPSNTMEEI